MQDKLIDLFISLLDSDEGVSEKVFSQMTSVAMEAGSDRLFGIIDSVEASEGRFYLPKLPGNQ